MTLRAVLDDLLAVWVLGLTCQVRNRAALCLLKSTSSQNRNHLVPVPEEISSFLGEFGGQLSK